jgi:hypothetical protein
MASRCLIWRSPLDLSTMFWTSPANRSPVTRFFATAGLPLQRGQKPIGFALLGGRGARQTATNNKTPRIPQDLTSFIAAGTITQAMLTDPNTLLRNHIAPENIIATTTISISTSPAAPLFGGGADNIAFLLGDPAALTNPVAAGPNAQTLKMTATFWIEIVEHVIVVPIFMPGQPPLTIPAETGKAGNPFRSSL